MLGRGQRGSGVSTICEIVVGDGLGETEALGEIEGLRLLLGEIEADGERLADGETEGLGDSLSDDDSLADRDELGDTEALGLTLALGELDGLRLADGEGDGLVEGLTDDEGLPLGEMLGDTLDDGDADAEGLRLGLTEGLTEALGLSDGLGDEDGETDAEGLSDEDGLTEALIEAEGLWLALGEIEGLGDELGVGDGLAEMEGDAEGPDRRMLTMTSRHALRVVQVAVIPPGLFVVYAVRSATLFLRMSASSVSPESGAKDSPASFPTAPYCALGEELSASAEDDCACDWLLPLSVPDAPIAPLPFVPELDIPVASSMETQRFVTDVPPKLMTTEAVERPEVFSARKTVRRRPLLSIVATCTHVSPQPVTVGVGPGEVAFASTDSRYSLPAVGVSVATVV